MNGFKEAQLAAMADYDKKITQRHGNDMRSDSWSSASYYLLQFARFILVVVTLRRCKQSRKKR